METVDIFKMVVGIFWGLFTIYGIFALFPPVSARLQKWEARCKRSKVTAPSFLQRLVFLLLASLFSAVTLADAFHRNFTQMTGISSGTILLLLLSLPALYYALGRLNKHGSNPGHDEKRTQ